MSGGQAVRASRRTHEGLALMPRFVAVSLEFFRVFECYSFMKGIANAEYSPRNSVG